MIASAAMTVFGMYTSTSMGDRIAGGVIAADRSDPTEATPWWPLSDDCTAARGDSARARCASRASALRRPARAPACLRARRSRSATQRSPAGRATAPEAQGDDRSKRCEAGSDPSIAAAGDGAVSIGIAGRARRERLRRTDPRRCRGSGPRRRRSSRIRRRTRRRPRRSDPRRCRGSGHCRRRSRRILPRSSGVELVVPCVDAVRGLSWHGSSPSLTLSQLNPSSPSSKWSSPSSFNGTPADPAASAAAMAAMGARTAYWIEPSVRPPPAATLRGTWRPTASTATAKARSARAPRTWSEGCPCGRS